MQIGSKRNDEQHKTQEYLAQTMMIPYSDLKNLPAKDRKKFQEEYSMISEKMCAELQNEECSLQTDLIVQRYFDHLEDLYVLFKQRVLYRIILHCDFIKSAVCEAWIQFFDASTRTVVLHKVKIPSKFIVKYGEDHFVSVRKIERILVIQQTKVPSLCMLTNEDRRQWVWLGRAPQMAAFLAQIAEPRTARKYMIFNFFAPSSNPL